MSSIVINTDNVTVVKTSNPAPAKDNSSKNNKETKPSTSTSETTSANVSSKAGSSTSEKTTKTNPSTKSKKEALAERELQRVTSATRNCENEKCEFSDTVEKLCKHKKYFCYKKNKTWWNIEVNSKWQWSIVKGDFGTAFCNYRYQKNTFEFEVYTDITCSELSKYNTFIQWNKGTKKTKRKNLQPEFGEEYDWKLTVSDWKKEGFKSKGKIKVNICLKNKPDDAESKTEMTTE